jgi:hypothetical protein
LVSRELANFIVEARSKPILVASSGYHFDVVVNQHFGLLLVSDFFICHECKTALVCWLKLRVLGLIWEATLILKIESPLRSWIRLTK